MIGISPPITINGLSLQITKGEMKFSKPYCIFFLVGIIAIVATAAQAVRRSASPPGGPRDTIPPKIA